MRLLYLPINDDEYPAGTLEAFRGWLGVENVRDFDYLQFHRSGNDHDRTNAHLMAMCKEFQPQVVHAQLQETAVIWPETLSDIRGMGIFVSLWMGDCRVSVPEYTARTSSFADLVLISSEGQRGMYAQAAGQPLERVRYWQIAVDWYRDFNMVIPFQEAPLPHKRLPRDVVFSGRYYGEWFPDGAERLAVVRAMAHVPGVDFAVVGSGFHPDVPCVGESPRWMQKWVYAAAKLSLGVNNFNHVHRYYSERQLCAMAAGGGPNGSCHLCWRVPGLEEEFVDGEHCVMYDSPEDAVEKARFLLAHDDLRKKIGEAGRAKVLAEHTWPKRIEQYAGILAEMGVQ